MINKNNLKKLDYLIKLENYLCYDRFAHKCEAVFVFM
jgi:hypothetical protein